MRPKTLSATALGAATQCLSRFQAEFILRGRGPTGNAALLGTSVHNALELYVKMCYLDRTNEPTIKLLLDLYELTFMQTFGTADASGDEFDEGVEMLRAWFKRTNFSEFTVISAEVKENFPIKVKYNGEPLSIPFNFIWDRHDFIEEGVYRVVDYKTNRLPYSPDDLRKLPQARAYGLAAQIKYPDAKEIWVEFDMLRHSGPVSILLTRESNAETWRWLKREAQRIIDTPGGDNVPETVNNNCRFCVRKSVCGAFTKAAKAGSVIGIDSPAELASRRAELEFTKAAVESALKEIDEYVFNFSRETDEFSWSDDSFDITVGQGRGMRDIDGERAYRVLGDDIMRTYGSTKLRMSDVDKLLKGDEISDEQKRQLKQLIFVRPGREKIIVKARNAFDEA